MFSLWLSEHIRKVGPITHKSQLKNMLIHKILNEEQLNINTLTFVVLNWGF